MSVNRRAAAPLVAATPESVRAVFASLEGMNPKWRVEIGRPEIGRCEIARPEIARPESARSESARSERESAEIDRPEAAGGWIRGVDFADATAGPFHAMLVRIGERAKTDDRKTVAASFALRFGWAGSVAIAPYLTHRCVPRVSLDNISIKFRETTLFERTALHEPCGWCLATDATDVTDATTVDERPHLAAGEADDPSDSLPLLRRLRDELHQQAAPVVRALSDWSGFAAKGSWGMITSSWASQFITVCERLGSQALAAPIMETFFAGDDDIGRMQPRTHPVTLRGVTHLYQRRASCCRYYLLPQGDLCASCPLVPHDERLRRNVEFMERQLTRASG